MSKWVNKRTNACERAYLLAHLFTSFACSPMFTNFVLRTKRINEHTQHTHSVDFCIGTHSTHNTHLSHSDYTIYTYILYIWKKLFLRICLVIVVQILWCCCYARSFFSGMLTKTPGYAIYQIITIIITTTAENGSKRKRICRLSVCVLWMRNV